MANIDEERKKLNLAGDMEEQARALKEACDDMKISREKFNLK